MEFARLGEVRSLIPSHVNVMALTATATKATRKAVVKRLSMKSPEIISITPDKPNVLYIVKDKPESIDEAMLPIVDKLHAGLIIFCRTYDECSRMYGFFKSQLGTRFTHPIGALQILLGFEWLTCFANVLNFV